MRTLIVFILCLFGMFHMEQSFGASPAFSNFYGTNDVEILTNQTTGKIIIGSRLISLTNLVWVTKTGNDLTGLRNRMDKPFQTPNAAKTAAVAGDTVVVCPGIYFATNLWKNNVNWHHIDSTLTNLSANPCGIYDNTELGTQGAITSNISGNGTFIVAHTDILTSNETGVISIVNSNCVINVQCKALLGGPDNTSFYALCIRDGNEVNVEVSGDIDSMGFLNSGTPSAILWNNGQKPHHVKAANVRAFGGYGLWCAGNKPGNFHLTCDTLIALDYSAVFWEPSHVGSKLWLNANEIHAGGSGVSLGSITVRGGKVYVQRAGKIAAGTGGMPVFYQDNNASPSELWVIANKATATNQSKFANLKAGYADFQINHYEDAGDFDSVRPSAWHVEGGTNYVHGGRVDTTWGPFLKAEGGMTQLEDMKIRTAGVAQATNYPVWLAGGAVILQNTTLIPPWQQGAHSIFAGSAQNVRIYGTVAASTNESSNVTIISGAIDVDTDIDR